MSRKTTSKKEPLSTVLSKFVKMSNDPYRPMIDKVIGCFDGTLSLYWNDRLRRALRKALKDSYNMGCKDTAGYYEDPEEEWGQEECF